MTRFSRHQFAVENCKPGEVADHRPRYHGDQYPFVVVPLTPEAEAKK